MGTPEFAVGALEAIHQSHHEVLAVVTAGTLAGIALGFPVAIYSIYYQVRVHFGKNMKAEKNKD